MLDAGWHHTVAPSQARRRQDAKVFTKPSHHRSPQVTQMTSHHRSEKPQIAQIGADYIAEGTSQFYRKERQER